jgi:hypothetical protein
MARTGLSIPELYIAVERSIRDPSSLLVTSLDLFHIALSYLVDKGKERLSSEERQVVKYFAEKIMCSVDTETLPLELKSVRLNLYQCQFLVTAIALLDLLDNREEVKIDENLDEDCDEKTR